MRQATLVWLYSCYRRIAKQLATVCLSITLREKIHLARLIKHEATRCEKVCCIGLTRTSSREQISSQERLIIHERRRADRRKEGSLSPTGSPAATPLIGKIVKSKCGLEQCSTNNGVAPSVKPPTNSECRRTKLPMQYKNWNNNCNNLWNYRVGIFALKIHMAANSVFLLDYEIVKEFMKQHTLVEKEKWKR